MVDEKTRGGGEGIVPTSARMLLAGDTLSFSVVLGKRDRSAEAI